MAKDKGANDKAAKGAKQGKTKIPKHIAGVKIPKALRDSGKAAIKLSQNPVARELFSAGLAAAAAAVAANEKARKTAQEGARDAAGKVADSAGAAAGAAGKIGAVIADVAGTAAQRFFGLDGTGTNGGKTSQAAQTPDAASVDAPPAAPGATAPRRRPGAKPGASREGA